ncbi:MAG: hypothetical protein KDJ73_10740 [Notoacmeibacter sp.]|nr:hypothetical protein [Notoacmeibacter sp.]MCC0032948.1 hypothetical protein [Brucellaceae bacterium]
MRRAAALLVPAALALASCQSNPVAVRQPAPVSNSAAIALLQTVNAEAQACWMKSKDAGFRAYRVIPELDTRIGKPRILVVSAKAAQGLPQYVIEASGTPPRLATYGPLASQPISARINSDVSRWATGGKGCKA